MTAPVVVFDVNETLLDLAALDPLFERYLGSAALRRRWFSEMLLTAMTLNHIDRYESFAAIARACARVYLTLVVAETGQLGASPLQKKSSTPSARCRRTRPSYPHSGS